MADSNPTSDLQAILADLARYTSDPQPSVIAAETDSVPSASPAAATAQTGQTPSLNTPDNRANDPRLKPQGRSTASPQPIDPATITTWQDGLRCVTKIAAQNIQFAASIRRMINEQRKNEMRWYSERQNLLKTQANRAKSSAQAQSILQNLNRGYGSRPGPGKELADNEAGIKELADFDRKIHAAQAEVDASMTAELKALGVPFFGTDRSLIVEEGASNVEEEVHRAKWSPPVTDAQFMQLRKRMIQHLEDLYRD